MHARVSVRECVGVLRCVRVLLHPHRGSRFQVGSVAYFLTATAVAVVDETWKTTK